MTATGVHNHPQLGFFEKLVAAASWAIGVAMFVTVGWDVLQPDDPLGAVSMLTSGWPGFMIVQTIALAAVVAALGTVIIGRRLSDAGVFAVCLGAAVASLQGGTMEAVLLRAAEQGAGSYSGVAGMFILESLVWFVVVIVAAVASGAVLHWCFGRRHLRGFAVLPTMAVADMPFLSGMLLKDKAPDVKKQADRGWRHTAVCIVAAFVLIRILSAGSPVGTVRHGQVFFAVTASFCLAGFLAQELFPTSTALWTYLAVPVVAVAAYLWTLMVASGEGLNQPVNIPPSTYLRALPLQYVMMGTLGALLSFWWTRPSHAARAEKEQKSGK